jgi:DnaJ-domain-containing protein 1
MDPEELGDGELVTDGGQDQETPRTDICEECETEIVSEVERVRGQHELIHQARTSEEDFMSVTGGEVTVRFSCRCSSLKVDYGPGSASAWDVPDAWLWEDNFEKGELVTDGGSSLDWLPGEERTPAHKRPPNRNFEASLGQTTKDIQTEMDRLDPDKWRASIANQHTKAGANGLPLADANPDDPGFVLRWSKDGTDYGVACDRYSRLRDNARTVYLWVHETRMRSNRPVVTGSGDFAAAQLPPAEQAPDATALGSGDDADNRDPWEVLGVSPQAPESVVKGAARSLKAQYHPDQSDGDRDEFKRIQRAERAMLADEGGDAR